MIGRPSIKPCVDQTLRRSNRVSIELCVFCEFAMKRLEFVLCLSSLRLIVLGLIVLGLIVLGLSCLCGNVSSADLPEGFKTIEARTLRLHVPESWKKVPLTSESRVAQFSIAGEPSAADMVVFYFGGPTGGVKANVERWIGQFEKEGLKLEMFQGDCTAGSYILVDTQGTWNKPDGPPFARKTIVTPNSRALNVIVKEVKDGKEDYYFMKLSGHQDVVSKQTDALRTAIGAKLDTETKFVLK
jgi:hypothetical protein